MSTALKKEQPDRPEPRELMNDHIVRLEVATETMAAYIGYLNTQIVNEEEREQPNQQKLKALEAQINQVLKERREIRPDNEELIAKAIYVYGPIMKALYA